MARDIDDDSGRPFIKANHSASGDVVRNPAHVAAGFGTAFEGTISLRIRDDDGTVIAEGSTQGGSNGVIGEFKADLQFNRRPNQRLGIVEAFEESASGSGEELHLHSRSSLASGRHQADLPRPSQSCLASARTPRRAVAHEALIKVISGVPRGATMLPRTTRIA